MAQRPNDFDPTTPSGATSPRSGDDELRQIKQFTQNGFNDMTAETGTGLMRHHLRAQHVTLESGGTFTGGVEGNVTGNVTGNASTASALQNSRMIGGVAFDGTADITLPGVNAAGNQSTTGNAATSTAWAAPVTFNLTGPVTGSATIDGSGAVNLATTLTTTISTGVTQTGLATFQGGVSIDNSNITFANGGSITLPDDVVDSAQIVGGSVDNVHITGMAASKLTGNFGVINAVANTISTTGTVNAGDVDIGTVPVTISIGGTSPNRYLNFANGSTNLMRLVIEGTNAGDLSVTGNVTANATLS